MGGYTEQQALNKMATEGVDANINLASATEIIPGMGSKNVTLAGTAEPLVAVQTFTKGIFIQAKPTNTGKVYFGVAGVSSSIHGARLSPGAFVSMDAPIGTKIDLNKLFIDVDVNGEGVTFFKLG